jgi:intracellular sulfur oxidation DsrE/DsrF family protein
MNEAAQQGVKLLACGNTMSLMHTTQQELNPRVGVVPAGIVEIMQKQKEGYAYVRP